MPSFFNHIRLPEHQGPEWAAQPFTQAHCHHIAILWYLAGLASVASNGVSDPSPIHEDANILFLCIGFEWSKSLEGPDLASVGGILDHDERSVWEGDMLGLLPHSFFDWIIGMVLLSMVKTPVSSRICLVCTPPIIAIPALYLCTVCALPQIITSSPGLVNNSTAAKLAMVVDGTIMEASNPKYWAIMDWNLLAVGSSSNTSSPT